MAARTFTSAGINNLWSNAANWDGGVSVPVDNDSVTIPSGQTCEFDVDQSAFANGIAGITITGTLKLTRTAGMYYLKMKAATQIAGAGTFDCGTDGDIIPFATKHTITGGAAWFIQGSGGLTMTVYAAEPTVKTILITALEPIGETVLGVDTDVTGDIWAEGDTIIIDDIDKARESETRMIAAGGIAAGTITITSGLTAAKSVGAVVNLISRNVKFIGVGAHLLQNFADGKLTIAGGQFTSPANRIMTTCPGVNISAGTFYSSAFAVIFSDAATISGGIFTDHSSYAIGQSSDSVISGAHISGCTAALSFIRASEISGITVKGCANAMNSLTHVVILSGTFFGNGAVLSSSSGMIIFGGTFSYSTTHISSCIISSVKNLSMDTAQNYAIVGSVFTAYNTLFTQDVFDYSYFRRETYSESIDHNQVQGAYKAWTRGGVTTKQAVTVPTGYDNAYQTVLEDADNEGYWQREQSVGSGQSVNLDLWLRKSASMAYLPRVQIFRKRDTDPFAGGTPLKTFTMTDSIDTWEHDTYTYSNDGTEDETLIIRFQGKNVSGVMYSALTAEVLNVDLTSALAHLVDIKGAGWMDESLVSLQADLNNPDQYKADVSAIDLSTIENLLGEIKGAGWTDETLVAIKSVIDAILVDTGTTLDGKITTIDGIVDAILVDTGTTLPATLAALNDISTADVLNATVEGTYTLAEVLRIIVGALAGKLSGAGTGTLTFRNISDTLDRIVATMDANHNRTNITLDGS